MSYAESDLCFVDSETRALPGLLDWRWGDVTKTSTVRYTRSSKVILLPYAIGGGEVSIWELRDFAKTLRWRDLPGDLAEFLKAVLGGEAKMVAWNSAFDRNALNYGMVRDRKAVLFEPNTFLDAMVQAVTSGLPPGLDGAAKSLGMGGKLPEGKELIQIFCVPEGATPDERPAEWETFVDYSAIDVEVMRDVWRETRPLSAEEWSEFWASEAINDRGLPVDRVFAEGAAEFAAKYKKTLAEEVKRISDGALHSPHQHVAIAEWAYDRVAHDSEMSEILVKEWQAPEDTGGDEETRLQPGKFSLDRQRCERLTAYMARLDEERGLTDDEFAVYEMASLKMYGASATPGKFAKALPALLSDDRLPNQYVFNGAAQTGRYSARGVQVHNLTRKSLGEDEAAAIEFLADGAGGVKEFRKRFGDPGRGLSLLVRPMFTAPAGRTLVWGDWSAIEARILPWLSASGGGEEVLGFFRRNDADPDAPDTYSLEAAKIKGTTADEVWQAYRDGDPRGVEARQTGKLAVLSLGFGGGIGALLSMAAAYGVGLSEAEGRVIVDNWRAGNPWAQAFWGGLWGAFQAAMSDPGVVYEAGRVAYMHNPDFLGGATFCSLPCGRLLTYRGLRWREVEVEDKRTGKRRRETKLTFRHGHATKFLWHGLLAENATQATAASLLRGTLRTLEENKTFAGDIVGHTHDEVIAEADEGRAAEAAEQLHAAMVAPRAWARGLPLKAEMTTNWYYSKAVGG